MRVYRFMARREPPRRVRRLKPVAVSRRRGPVASAYVRRAPAPNSFPSNIIGVIAYVLSLMQRPGGGARARAKSLLTGRQKYTPTACGGVAQLQIATARGKHLLMSANGGGGGGNGNCAQVLMILLRRRYQSVLAPPRTTMARARSGQTRTRTGIRISACCYLRLSAAGNNPLCDNKPYRIGQAAARLHCALPPPPLLSL